MNTTTKKQSVLLTEQQVIDLIRQRQAGRTLRELAEELEVSPSFISEIYSGTRKPGDKILKHFRILKTQRVIVEYRQGK